MKTVLIIAPQFVPSSYPPAQRVRLFANSMTEFGWKPVVLTVEPQYLEEAPDWEFTKLISKDVEIIRTKAFPASFTRKLGIGDLGIRSLKQQYDAAKKICRERKIDLLFIPGPPWHTFLVGPWIRKKFGIPYVLDYIDPWVSSLGENGKPISKAHWFREMAVWLEPKAVRHASHIVSVSEGTNDGVRVRYSFLKKENFTALPYGAEKNDFEYARQNPKPNPFFKKQDGFFHLVYMGSMLPTAYETLRVFFRAVARLKKEKPDFYKRLRIYFVGTTYAVDPKENLVLPEAGKAGVAEIVTEHPRRIPYLDANSVLMQSDALLALGGTEIHYTASKIFPTILADKPILAVYHEKSSVVQILKDANAGLSVSFTAENLEAKADEIFEALKKIMEPGYVRPAVDWAAFEKNYSAKSMSRRLCRAFDAVLEAPQK